MRYVLKPFAPLVLSLGVLSMRALAVDSAEVHKEELTKSGASWDGTPLPSYPEGAPEITIMRYEFPPGSVLPLHQHPVINAGVILRGELTLKSDDKTLHLKAGDSIVELVGQWHSGKNEGNETAELIVFYAGATNTPITVKK